MLENYNKFLVFGKTGQIAKELQKKAPNAMFISRADADLSVPGACEKAIFKYKPSAVINAAAYTAVDKAEIEPALANAINGIAPKEMAQACANLCIPFIQISTDYVFSGKGSEAWLTNGDVSPIGSYGFSKLMGEFGTKNVGGIYGILRTSWVFSAHGNNFLKKMIELAKDRDQLSVVFDQFGGPTSAHDVSLACLKIAEGLIKEPTKSGVYHFSGFPTCSWFDFAQAIFDAAGITITINKISAEAYAAKMGVQYAKRPTNSRLDCTSLKNSFGISQPDWRKSMAHVLMELDCLNEKS